MAVPPSNRRDDGLSGALRSALRSDFAGLALPSLRERFVREVGRALLRRCGIKRGDRLVVAVSGGADSMALLAALSSLATRSNRGYVLEVVYVHHHLRAEADSEERGVASAAAALGWKFHGCAIYPQEDDNRGGNLAARARELRYEALREVAELTGASAILTGHHGTDQLETVLLALIRGASVAGLAAMPWRTDSAVVFGGGGEGGGVGVPIVRPLLDQTHRGCVRLCKSIDWRWYEDESNLDEAKRRNLLRSKVLPVLREMAPDLERRVWRSTDLLGDASRLIDEVVVESFPEGVTADGVTTWSRAELATPSNLILGAGLRKAIRQRTGSIDAVSFMMIEQLITAIRDQATHRRVFDWPRGLEISITSQHFEMRRSGELLNTRKP